jgi:hypothetical protein
MREGLEDPEDQGVEDRRQKQGPHKPDDTSEGCPRHLHSQPLATLGAGTSPSDLALIVHRVPVHQVGSEANQVTNSRHHLSGYTSRKRSVYWTKIANTIWLNYIQPGPILTPHSQKDNQAGNTRHWEFKRRRNKNRKMGAVSKHTRRSQPVWECDTRR